MPLHQIAQRQHEAQVGIVVLSLGLHVGQMIRGRVSTGERPERCLEFGMGDGVHSDDLSPQRFHLGHGGIECTENLLPTVVLEEACGEYRDAGP